MTVTFFLVRHAAHDNLSSYLAGRATRIMLGPAGREQAARLAQRLARERIDKIYTSPRERAYETATAIASACRLDPPETHDALDEVDFGSWTGKSFDVLNRDEQWQRWNMQRGLAQTPGGENMLDVQRRMFGLIHSLAGRSEDDRRIVLVSHCDVIKTVVSHVLCASLDAWARMEVAPGSITILVMGNWGAKIITLNEMIS
ncbi:histidine phosphatase family protein (plasmid) [Rhizobium sp. CB3090]|uniref:histidine phosphatase family protein n=1 Tax=Rhizobium sp. CB3090 TaxID=3039156 RepID=UPI0024B1D4CE|nr:histidine phosphatase family protein [Rhizobium sp. CB3090]WFU11669.1 histidine phosphatase family protein [Rhizobium sp. CB3090]